MLLLSMLAFASHALAQPANAPNAPLVATTSPVLGVIDARHGGRAVALMLPTSARGKSLSYFNLFNTEKTRAECCVLVGRKVAPRQASNVASPAAISATGMLKRSAKEGFFGLLLERTPNAVKRVSANEVQMSWDERSASTSSPGSGATRVQRVIHCLSSEGLNIRLIDGASQQELQRYYVALGMDVAPDCTDALMPLK